MASTVVQITGPIPRRMSGGAVGFDLEVAGAEAIAIPPHSVVLVDTGLVIRVVTQNVAAFMMARSSLWKRGLRLANALAVIDHDYWGEDDTIKMAIENVTGEPVEVKPGDRLAQLVFLRTDEDVTFTPLTPKKSNRGGFGATGGA